MTTGYPEDRPPHAGPAVGPLPASRLPVPPGRGRLTLAVIAVLALVLTATVMRPFAPALFMAAVLAGAFHPLHVRLMRVLRGRRLLSAALLTGTVVLALLLPLSWLTAVLVKQVTEAVAWVREALRSGGIEGLIAYLPDMVEPPLRAFVRDLPEAGAQLQQLAEQALPAVGAVGGVLSATAGFVLQTVLSLIAFFFLLLDGPRLVRWIDRAIPLEPGRFLEILDAFRRVTRAVLVSTLATAGLQSLVALLGYLLAGIPQPLFFTVLTFVFALIPLVGAATVVVVIGAVELAGGHLAAAIFLFIWGVLIVGVVDNVVKPYLIRGGAELHGAVVFFALLGGLAAFGPIGIVAGPLIVAFLIAVVRIYARDYGPGHIEAP